MSETQAVTVVVGMVMGLVVVAWIVWFGADGRALAPATPGACRYCRCTDDRACWTSMGPCSWVDRQHTLCTACQMRRFRRRVR